MALGSKAPRASIEWVDLERWHHGRVVLIGDAAHAGPPMMAQGGCMAMEDAWVLAEVLSHAESVESALDRYARRRRPRVDWVQQESRAWARATASPLPTAMRPCASGERRRRRTASDRSFRNPNH
jgi:2-polyprenyl-6-methoxyphenol hydroxylase-like FAD-dependent oxidoreductase